MKPLLIPVVVCALAFATGALAHLTPEAGSKQAGFDQRLGAPIPATLAFRDERGANVRLTDYYGSVPIVLVFAWYGCTTLCPTVIGHLADAIDRSGLAQGSYRVLVASIDPRDSPADAMNMKRRHLANPHTDAGAWHLLTGREDAIGALTRAAGFRYAWDDETHQYAHPAGVVLLTPQGTIARYVFGFDYTPTALRDDVEAAAAHEIASPVDRLLLLCFHFAPAGRYAALVLQALRVASVAMLVVAMVVFVAKRRRRVAR
ncbi:MAG TPA: SCO family protein [Casimicrobiaceae bacterium]|nr:SCO family protein [Casimicrobiaceae bacterium]